ncbi:guanine nucleotide binding protein, alpha subunit [Armillaria gallica]|uniref:Guanine nucleotide binding protein, alpha subunit n=1 Tax=Armillaria gallica TaxID=47427 RepID=A0A2H3D120_ARMGA|nr:guanine nucleotide binding protein, alpha subunit [Armillaria gallica]
MGICSSSQGPEVIGAHETIHINAEKELKWARFAKLLRAVLLLGTGDSGKTTVLKQMSPIHNISFSQDVEYYRQLIPDNLTGGLKCILDAMYDMGLTGSKDNIRYIHEIKNWWCVRDGEPFQIRYCRLLKALWCDPGHGLEYFFSDLDRLFDHQYQPTEQDIIQWHVRKIGITETVFYLQDREVTVVVVGSQKFERQNILFLVILSGYDQCLDKDEGADQMHDTMAILLLNRSDLFDQKVPHSDIKDDFPVRDVLPWVCDVRAGHEYFKHRFSKLATRAERRDIYIHVITATDTVMLQAVMATVEVSFPRFCPSSYAQSCPVLREVATLL